MECHEWEPGVGHGMSGDAEGEGGQVRAECEGMGVKKRERM